MSNFKVIASDGKSLPAGRQARAGVLKTAHGDIETPVFMPVGTQATVKALTPDDLKNAGAQVILGNTYHLYLRPGSKLIKKMGGLHKFMGWKGPILTDSGGFQAFSLGAMIEHGIHKVQNAKLKVQSEELEKAKELDKNRDQSLTRAPLVSKMTEEGVVFISHLDGSEHLLSPEKSMEVQLDLGSDICLVLDELLSPVHNPEYAKESLERTHRWEIRSKEYFDKNVKQGTNPEALLFGIVQGVYDKDIREKEAKWVAEQGPACRQAGFDGVSIGGSFGTSEYYGGEEVDWAASEAIYKTIEWVVPHLPEEWPKHILGIGEVRDFFECIERGVDMFDCVAPTRRARNGSLYICPKSGGNVSNKFTLTIARAEFTEDKDPIDSECQCYTCQNFTRAYLRHLFMAKELLYYHLATIHNVYFMLNLVKSIRKSIIDHNFYSLKKSWLG